jgi:DNA-binding transcriptional MocR family regulator
MPQIIVDAIDLGPSRFTMVDAIVRLIESVRQDFDPDAKTWDTFINLLILHRMWATHRNGRLASAAGIAKSIGMPRSTVVRRLGHLQKRGAIERRGTRYALVPQFINSPAGVTDSGTRGFKRRVARWREADKKMTIVGD